jgi:integrase/recombinase XerD
MTIHSVNDSCLSNDLIQRFHEDCILREVVSTKDYISRAREFCDFLEIRGKSPAEVTKDDIRSFLIRLKGRDLRSTTIDRIFTCLSAFYEFLIAEELIDYNPITPFRKYYLRIYKKNNDTEIRKLIEVEDASRLVNSILDSRDKCILVLLLKTGMRVGELMSLDLDDVDLAKGEITLKHSKKRSNRILYIDNEAVAVMSRWLAARKNRTESDEVALFINKFGKRISKLSIEIMTKKHAVRVGLHDPNSCKLEDKFTPHCCRHWFVTHLIRSGMPRDFVKELRGDVRREAIDIYNHIDRKELRESYLAHIPQLGI